MTTIKKLSVAALLCVFISTNVAYAYSTPATLESISDQLHMILGNLSKLIGSKSYLSSSTTQVLATRTCQIEFTTVINGQKKHATTTLSGLATDEFAIGVSVQKAPAEPMYANLLQSETLKKGSVVSAVGYFTPAQYQQQKAVLEALKGDVSHAILPVKLHNAYHAKSGKTFSVEAPYAEGRVVNKAVEGVAAGSVSITANVLRCNPGLPMTVKPPEQSVKKPAQNTKQPNIVFVMVDDLDVKTMEKLPKLNALMADKGMTFENHFTSISTCCPARAATLCGTYAHNNGVFTNENRNDGASPGGYTAFKQFGNEEKTMAVWLQNAGYRTALMGKYFNGYRARPGVPLSVPVGWNEWVVPVDGNAYSQYNYTLNVNGKAEEYYLPYCTNRGSGKPCPVDTTRSTLAEREAGFMGNVLGKKAEDFITQSKNDGVPFFLYLAPYAPHGPATPAPQHEKLLTNAAWLNKHPLPISASFNEADISDKPTWLRSNAGLLTPLNISLMTNIYQRRVVSMFAVEDMMRDLIDTLTQNGQLDNTYIVFTSDNGFHLGEHRLKQGKMTQFDTDIRIPLIIRGPGVKAGSVSEALTATVDIAPTFASLAGVPVPSSVDGRSFKETLLGGSSAKRYALLLEHGEPTDPTAPPIEDGLDEPRDADGGDQAILAADYVRPYSGIRTLQYTYIHYSENGEEELYDNVNDPEQLNNVATVAGDVFMKRLRKWTEDLSTCKGAACRAIESDNRLDGIKGALDGKACFFNDKQINNGKQRTFYSKRTVEPGQSCDAVKQVRICTDGKLSGSNTYNKDSCTVLERFTGVNFNQRPEDLDLRLVNETGATWMRANATLLPYYKAGLTSFPDWDKFRAAHASGKKGIVNLMWDFEGAGQRIPAPDSEAEKKLFAYLDTVVLPELLPVADIIVTGNEPFVNSLNADWKYSSAIGDAPMALFYKRVTEHVHDYMVAKGIRDKHKLYVGAFTRLYDDIMQTGKGSYAVKSLLEFADKTPYVDGVDIHTHVGPKVFADIEASLKFVTKYTDKPITNTEYTYIHSQADHLNETLNANDTKPFSGKTFAETFNRNGKMLVIDYVKSAGRQPVTLEEWHGFLKSRSWTVDHFLPRADAIFKKYPVNGVTFGFRTTSLNFSNPLPWYMNFLYTSPKVKLGADGLPEGNYQYLEDFKKLQEN